MKVSLSTNSNERILIYLNYESNSYSRSGTHYFFLRNQKRFPVHYLQLRTPLIFNLPKLFRLVKTYSQRPKIFIVMAPANAIAILLRIITRGPIVLDAGWPISDSTFIREKSIFLKIKSFLLDLLTFWAAELIFLESKSQLEFCSKRYRFAKNKFTVSYTGFNELQMLEEKASSFNERKLLMDIPAKFIEKGYIFFRGKLNSESGLENLMEVANQYGKYCFVIASPGLDAHIPENVVVLSGWLDWQSLSALYRNAAVVIGQTSSAKRIRRTIAHKVYEAAFFGKAYISAESPALLELFENETSILFCRPDDYKDLGLKIEFLMENAKLRESMGASMLEKYEKFASQRIIASTVLKQLREVGDF